MGGWEGENGNKRIEKYRNRWKREILRWDGMEVCIKMEEEKGGFGGKRIWWNWKKMDEDNR